VSHHQKTSWPLAWVQPVPWPKQPSLPDLRWQNTAECRQEDDEVSERLVEASRQHEVTDLVAALCLRCPVIRPCLEAGQGMRADGVWGGVVLRDGAPAEVDRRRQETVA
jgi:hypothetical protein